MKRKPAGEEPLVHSPLVPQWGDEFDLRLYFACIHPGQYELRSEQDRVFAVQLLGAVVAYSVNQVGIYRGAIKAAPRGDVLRAVVRSVRSAQRLGQPGYSVWYEKPEAGFAGLSPREWFETQQQPELARLLRLKKPVEDQDVFGQIVVTNEPGAPVQSRAYKAKAHPGSRSNSLHAASRQKPFLVINEISSPGPDWDDEFALTPYFVTWSPLNYELGSSANYRLAQEVFDAAMGEFGGWVTIYRTALQASTRLAGAMEMVVRCAMKIVELGLPRYLEWFHVPQPEFGRLSPDGWFHEKQLIERIRVANLV